MCASAQKLAPEAPSFGSSRPSNRPENKPSPSLRRYPASAGDEGRRGAGLKGGEALPASVNY